MLDSCNVFGRFGVHHAKYILHDILGNLVIPIELSYISGIWIELVLSFVRICVYLSILILLLSKGGPLLGPRNLGLSSLARMLVMLKSSLPVLFGFLSTIQLFDQCEFLV